jgi:hypothetical protein
MTQHVFVEIHHPPQTSGRGDADTTRTVARAAAADASVVGERVARNTAGVDTTNEVPVLLLPARLLDDAEVRDRLSRRVPRGTLHEESHHGVTAADTWQAAITAVPEPDVREFNDEIDEWETLQINSFDQGMVCLAHRSM